VERLLANALDVFRPDDDEQKKQLDELF